VNCRNLAGLLKNKTIGFRLNSLLKSIKNNGDHFISLTNY